MPPKGDLGNMHLPIPLVGEVIGVVSRNLYENEEVVCPTVAQQWVDRYRRENPAEADPRVVAYGAYLLVLRVVYGVRRRPRTPWSQVWFGRTLALWLLAFREVAVAQRNRRWARIEVRNLHRRRRIGLARARTVPYQITTPQVRWDCGPLWGTVRLRNVYERVEYGHPFAGGVNGFRSTRHLGYEVRDHSGRHGYPAVTRGPDRWMWYTAMELEYSMITRPNWVVTTRVGGYNRLTMPNPPDEPHIEHLDSWGRGPYSDDRGCDTETDSDTEDDEILSRRGRYPNHPV